MLVASVYPPVGSQPMTRALYVPVVLICLVAADAAMADGKFYVLDETPVGVPYQRALIIHDGATETLLLQSVYLISDQTPATEIAWVVPVPAIPELGSTSHDDAWDVFIPLSALTVPRVTRVGTVLWIVLPWAVALTISVCLISWLIGRPKRWPTRRWHLDPRLSIALIVFSLAFLVVCLLPARRDFGIKDLVNVIEYAQVGVYDVHVLRSTDATALLDWLRNGGFHFNDADKAVLDDYIERGWYFVASKVRVDEDHHEEALVADGLVAPLMLKFNTPQPVYPLALTATVGRPTELLLYVISRSKVTCDDRLNTAHAGPTYSGLLDPLIDYAEPPHLVSASMVDFRYVTKFKGTLNSDEMKKDLVFSPAPDDEPVREHVVMW